MLEAFLDRHYCGPSMVIAAAGAVDHDQLVDARRAARCRPRRTRPARRRSAATYRGGEIARRRATSWRRRSCSASGPALCGDDFYTAQVLSSILGGGMASRLFQEVREKRGLCYSIYSFYWPFADTGVFGVHAATGPEDVAELMPVVVDELERDDRRRSPTGSEARQAQLRAGLLMTLESPVARAGQMARQILLFGRSFRSRRWWRGSRRSSVDARPRPRRRASSAAAPRRWRRRPGQRHDRAATASPTASAPRHGLSGIAARWRSCGRSRRIKTPDDPGASACCCARRASPTIPHGRSSATRAAPS